MYYVVITRHNLRLLVTIFHSIVSCIGQPVPRVIWYEDGRAIEGLLEYLPNKQIRNVLHIAQLSRANHNVRYSCAASNSRILPPLVSAITILMRRKSFLNFFQHFSLSFPSPFSLLPTTHRRHVCMQNCRPYTLAQETICAL